jgi:iron complex outermembrane receptor protein
LALASVLPTVAVAQTQTPPSGADAAPTEVEEIVVTGLRRGLADSISIKRRETSIVEAVSAEDIGKFPDTNIAESFNRVPGITINGSAAAGYSLAAARRLAAVASSWYCSSAWRRMSSAALRASV